MKTKSKKLPPPQKLTHPVASGRTSMAFCPHSFDTTVERGPKIIVSERAYDTMRVLVDECEIEIGWMGIVEERDCGFYIDRIFLPKQSCHEERTRFEPDAMFEILKEMRDLGIDKSKLRFWGHSHVRFDPTPSSDDWRQIGVFADSEWMLTGIANKWGKIRFQAHYYKHGISIGDIPWMIETKSVPDDVREKIRTKILSDVTILQRTEEEEAIYASKLL